RDHIWCAGKGLNPTNGPNLTTRNAGHYTIYCFDESGTSQQGVLTIVHCGGAGMIGESFNRNVPPADANDTFNYANVDLFLFQNTALLDMQLEVSSNTSLHSLNAREFRRIAANKFDSVANRFAATTDEIELSFGQLTIDGATADQTAFFILKD